MKQEQKQLFIQQITTGNKSQIIAVLYDMLLVDLEDAKKAIEDKEQEEYMAALRHANEVLSHLQGALNFKYEISNNLYSLYDFSKRAIAKSMYSGRAEGVEEAVKVIGPLSESFHELAKQDDSAPLMENTQKVTAGLTYGRNDINEMTDSTSRGFLV